MYRTILFCLLSTLSALPVLAQSDLEDTLFGGEAEGSVVTEAEETDFNPAEALLESERVSISGSFSVAGALSLTLEEMRLSSGLSDLTTRLILDARPSSDLRVLVKTDLGYSTTSGVALELRELFADFDVDSAVFVRAGKQTINWGVGYFFSPANLINTERVDPQRPGLELAGPVAFKAQYPIGTDNLTGYVILDDFAAETNAELAARYEFLFEGFEFTAGGLYAFGEPWAIAATATGSLAGLTVFAETVAQQSDRVFVVRDPGSASGIRTETREGTVFFSGTVGGRFSYTGEDQPLNLSGSAQYFFNGLGYADASVWQDHPAAISELLEAGQLRAADLTDRGQHYVGAALGASDVAELKVSPSLFWLGNLSDGSGTVSVGLPYSGINLITPQLSYRYSYGAPGAELTPLGSSSSVRLELSVQSSF